MLQISNDYAVNKIQHILQQPQKAQLLQLRMQHHRMVLLRKKGKHNRRQKPLQPQRQLSLQNRSQLNQLDKLLKKGRKVQMVWIQTQEAMKPRFTVSLLWMTAPQRFPRTSIIKLRNMSQGHASWKIQDCHQTS